MAISDRIAARTAAAVVAAGGLVAGIAAPGGGQTIEVGEVRGDAYGIRAELSSDLGDGELPAVPLADRLEAVDAGDAHTVNSIIDALPIELPVEVSGPTPSRSRQRSGRSRT